MAKSVKSTEDKTVTPGEQQPEPAKVETVDCVYLSYTPCYFSYKGKEFSLHNNETYTLPQCSFVKTLIAQGRLVKK